MNILPIIVQPIGGLCNRMRTIAAAAQLADILNRRVYIIWTRDPSLNASFKSLFKSLPYKIIEVHLWSFLHLLIWHFCKKIFRYKVYDDSWIYANARGKDPDLWISKVKNHPIYIQSCADIIINGGDYSVFQVTDDIKSRTLESYDNTIGIHIRRTDNEKSERFSPTELFIKKIEEEIKSEPSIRFYLATDDSLEEQKLLQKFPNNIICYKKESLDRNSPIAIRDAVVDLYNLAHCKKIYGSYWSSFSDIAALWGGIEKTVLKTDNAN